jgi:RNA polymerase primary sigma factor
MAIASFVDDKEKGSANAHHREPSQNGKRTGQALQDNGNGERGEPLQSYLDRLMRTPLLSASEERHLTRQVALGGPRAVNAKTRLVEANMRLVVSVAKMYRASGIPIEDLIQEGAIGLMTATERFDPSRGYRFSTYATQWIRQAIGRAVDNKAKAIRLPAHVGEAIRKMERVRAQFHRDTGDEPTPEVISERTGLTQRKVYALLGTTQEPVSLDMPVGDEDGASLGAMLHDNTSPDPQNTLIRSEFLHELHQLIELLDEREQDIVRKRFGFDGSEGCVLQQIGDDMNLSRERVRQIEMQALRKMRTAARHRALRDYLAV